MRHNRSQIETVDRRVTPEISALLSSVGLSPPMNGRRLCRKAVRAAATKAGFVSGRKAFLFEMLKQAAIIDDR